MILDEYFVDDVVVVVAVVAVDVVEFKSPIRSLLSLEGSGISLTTVDDDDATVEDEETTPRGFRLRLAGGRGTSLHWEL